VLQNWQQLDFDLFGASFYQFRLYCPLFLRRSNQECRALQVALLGHFGSAGRIATSVAAVQETSIFASVVVAQALPMQARFN
jgi:hypothetical protein